MKILQVYQVYYPDNFTGIPNVILNLTDELNTRGVQTDVFCLSNASGDKPVKVGNHFVYQAREDFRISSSSFSFSMFWKFRSLIEVNVVLN